INLSKVGEYWWSAILEGEEQIDIDKINKERSMATVDEEEHAVLDRLYNSILVENLENAIPNIWKVPESPRDAEEGLGCRRLSIPRAEVRPFHVQHLSGEYAFLMVAASEEEEENIVAFIFGTNLMLLPDSCIRC
ncbi:putative NudC domain-containing protein, partial [Naja naja]